MPIKCISTASNLTSDSLPLNLDDETKSKLYSLIEAFLLFTDKPSDEQVHHLAVAIGLTPEQLEGVIYEFFSETLEDDSTLVESDFTDSEILEEDEEDIDASSIFNEDDIVESELCEDSPIKAGDELSDASENDGEPDLETDVDSDPMKENTEQDGAPDTEQIKENLGKE